jgi:hypothetical protein
MSTHVQKEVYNMSTKAEELDARISKLELVQKIIVAVLVLFARQDVEAEDRQQQIRMLLGLEK